MGGPWLLRTLSDPVEPETEERRTQEEKVRRAGAVCALLLRVVRGALRTVLVSWVGAAAGLACPLLRGRGRSCPLAVARLWSQRHPPIKGCKSRGSLATPRSQSLGEVARPGPSKPDCMAPKGS